MENQQNHEHEHGQEHEHEKHNSSNKTIMAIVAYILFFVPLLTEDKNDPFVHYHVKQGLALLIAAVVVSIFGTFVPIIGWILWFPLSIVIMILFIIGVVNAATGKQKPLPIIGKFGEGLKI